MIDLMLDIRNNYTVNANILDSLIKRQVLLTELNQTVWCVKKPSFKI